MADAPCVSKYSISSAVSWDTCLPALSGWLSHKHTHADFENWRQAGIELPSLVLYSNTLSEASRCTSFDWLQPKSSFVFQTEDVFLYSQTVTKEVLSQGKFKRGSQVLASCPGDAVYWLGLQSENTGVGSQDGVRGESAQPDSSACCCIDKKKHQSGDVTATRKTER